MVVALACVSGGRRRHAVARPSAAMKDVQSHGEACEEGMGVRFVRHCGNSPSAWRQAEIAVASSMRLGGLTFGLGGFCVDAQPGRQVGLAQPERLLEEAAGLARQRPALGRGQLDPRRVDARCAASRSDCKRRGPVPAGFAPRGHPRARWPRGCHGGDRRRSGDAHRQRHGLAHRSPDAPRSRVVANVSSGLARDCVAASRRCVRRRWAVLKLRHRRMHCGLGGRRAPVRRRPWTQGIARGPGQALTCCAAPGRCIGLCLQRLRLRPPCHRPGAGRRERVHRTFGAACDVGGDAARCRAGPRAISTSTPARCQFHQVREPAARRTRAAWARLSTPQRFGIGQRGRCCGVRRANHNGTAMTDLEFAGAVVG